MIRKTTLALGPAMIALVWNAGAQAQAIKANATTQDMRIPAQDLGNALKDFARATGLQLAARPDLLKGRRSHAIRGRMTAAQALARLTKGTDVEANIVGGTIVVRLHAPRPAPVRSPRVATQTTAKAAAATSRSEAATASDDDIVVTGYAAAFRKSTDMKRRTRVVSDSISADDMGELPVNNVAESMARMPGVNAVRNPTTGEGDRITIRGLSTELNTYAINGVRMGGAGSRDDRFFRGVRLSVLPPDGIDSITVYKSLTPDRDGDALGGGIDIRTPTAFDRKPRYFLVNGQAGWLDKFDRRGAGQISASMGHRITDDLGVFLTGSWSRRRSQYESNGGDGDNQPRRWYANSETLGWDPSEFVMRGMTLQMGETDVRRWGVNGSVDWRPENHQFHLRGQYNRYSNTQFSNQLNFRNDTGKNSTRLVQRDPGVMDLVQPDQAVIGSAGKKGRLYSYTTAQIIDQDKDGVITDADRKTKSLYSLYGGSGQWNPQGFRLRRYWDGARNTGTLASVNVGGVSDFGTVKLDYDLSFSRSEDNLDDSYDLQFRGDKYGWLGNTGVGVSSMQDPRFPKWVLNQTGLAAVQDPSQYPFNGLSGEVGGSGESLWQSQINAQWTPDSPWLDTIKLGAKAFRSRRNVYNGTFLNLSATGTMADFSGFFGRPVTTMFGGVYTDDYRLGAVIDNSKMLAELQRAERGESKIFSGLAVSPNAARMTGEDSFRFDERVVAGYAMATAHWGLAQLIGGVRVEQTANHIDAFAIDPVQGDRYTTDRSSFLNVLPSIHLNYDLSPRTLARAAVWTSFSRPDIARMSSSREYGYDTDPDGDGVENPTSQWLLLSIRQGNPDLKPMRAVNFDLSLEHYAGKVGAYSVAVFYKDIRNFLFRSSSSNVRNGTLGAMVSPDGVAISMPNNGRQAKVYGAEVSVQQIMHWLPGPLADLGFNVNLTLQKSQAETGIGWHPAGYKLPLVETPERIANIQLFWNHKGAEIYASWTHQSKFLGGIQDFGNDPYDHGYSFIDLTARYKVVGDVALSVQVQNLLDNYTYWETFGPGIGSSRAYTKNGRSVSFGVNAVF